MSKLRPSPALAVAVFALFVALGGVGVAATNYLPRNSVGTAQIQNDSVTRAKIAHQSITSILIKPGSLTASDFAAGQIPAGPKGDKGDTGATGATGQQGPKGDQGATGPAGTVGTLSVASGSAGVAAGTSNIVYVPVPSGTQAVNATASWGPLAGQYGGYISIWPNVSSGKIVGYWASGFNHVGGGTHAFTLWVAYG